MLTSTDAFNQLRERRLAKGDAIKIAEIAGLMASKRTSDLIPLCHQIALDYSKLEVQLCEQSKSVRVLCQTQVTDKTGCEMEALVGATTAALTIYDMCKGLDKEIVLTEARLLRKTGGKSGDYEHSSSDDTSDSDHFSSTKIN